MKQNKFSGKLFYRIFCVVVVPVLLANCSTKPQASVTEKPNIVFIFTDDQTWSAIHALGNKEIITPNLDKLVKSGTSFTNAYNMGAWHGAVCVASRSMIISGRAVWQAKQIIPYWSKGDSTQKTWGQLMQQAGYTTYMTGKWHVDVQPEKVFQVVKNVRPGMAPDNWNHAAMEKLFAEKVATGQVTANDIMPLGYNRPKNETDNSWNPYDTAMGGFWKGGRHWSEVLRDDAIGYIETAAKKDEPFFMYIASNAPHDPRQAPKKYQDLYPLDKISLPKSWLPEYTYKDAIGNGPSLRDEALAPFPRTAYATKKHIQEYYASVTHLDEQIGAILDALEKSGKEKNTYIFFTSDHGLAIGRHGLLGKQSLFEHSVKPPLIMAGPGIPANKKVEAPVYLQDVMATSLELAGVPKPDYVFFNSLLELAKGNTTKSKYDAIYGSYMDLERSIRKGDFKLIVYPKIKKTLLFNLKEDPEEMHDLSDNPKYQAKVLSLFKDLVQLQKELADPLDLQSWYQEMHKSGPVTVRTK